MSTNLTDSIIGLIENELVTTYTMLPATITDVSLLSSENKVSVQPAQEYLDGTGEYQAEPILAELPVQWPAGGGAVMTFPLAIGDDVMVVFSKDSNVEFQASTEGTVQPFDTRQHDIADGYVVPSIFRDANQPSPNPDDVEIKYGDSLFAIQKDGTVKSDNGKSSITQTPDGDIQLVNEGGDYNINADGTHSGNAAETWSMTNGTGELIDLLSQTLTEISNATVNTMLGAQPLINKAVITALIAQVDSFKE